MATIVSSVPSGYIPGDGEDGRVLKLQCKFGGGGPDCFFYFLVLGENAVFRKASLYYILLVPFLCTFITQAGILFSVLITGVLTDAIKDAVGRPRPDYFWRCFPDGIAVYDNITTSVICHGDAGVIKEGHKSFPSSHSSWSFAGLGFLSWYLAGKITVFDRRGHVAKLCVIILPLLVAAIIAISRVDDYWHHWQDVFAGGILGMVVASVCYLKFFPPPSDGKENQQVEQTVFFSISHIEKYIQSF